jgi:hypothetical protein
MTFAMQVTTTSHAGITFYLKKQALWQHVLISRASRGKTVGDHALSMTRSRWICNNFGKGFETKRRPIFGRNGPNPRKIVHP